MISLQGDNSKFSDGENLITLLIVNFKNSGYQLCVVQWGTIKIPVDFSSLIFFKILVIKENGGKAYQKNFFLVNCEGNNKGF